jgi:hypothetical protein
VKGSEVLGEVRFKSNQSTKQASNQSIKQPTKQASKQAINQPSKQASKQAINQPTNQPINQSSSASHTLSGSPFAITLRCLWSSSSDMVLNASNHCGKRDYSAGNETKSP